jgi:hypothetical protein
VSLIARQKNSKNTTDDKVSAASPSSARPFV